MVARYESGSAAPSVEKLAKAATNLKVEFYVRGYRVSFHQNANPPIVPAFPQQLSFEYEKSRTYRRSLVRITPRKGKLIIYAEIPA